MGEEGKTLVQDLFATLNSRKGVNALDEYFSGQYVSHNPELPPGLAGVRQFYAMLRTAFPDGSLVAEDVNGGGDKVTVQSRLRGTQEGEVWGFRRPAGRWTSPGLIPGVSTTASLLSTGVDRIAMTSHSRWARYPRPFRTAVNRL